MNVKLNALTEKMDSEFVAKEDFCFVLFCLLTVKSFWKTKEFNEIFFS